MSSVPDQDRCRHGEVAAWCGESECIAARTSLPARVWRTKGGSTYHRTPECHALARGQRLAAHRGQEAHTPEQVPLAVAMSAGLAECFHCFPERVPPDAKPCQVRVAGSWRDGLLLEWRRGPDRRWKGLVKYQDKAGHCVVLKDQADLRPDGG